MRDCPPAESLEHFLGEELTDPERQCIEAHVEDCTDCQETLHRLTLSTPGPAPARLLSALAGVTLQEAACETEAFLHQLKQRVLSTSSDRPRGLRPGLSETAEPPAVADYEIHEELGRGAVGVVYRARHRALDRLVALKVILAGPHLSPEARQRFRVEAQAIARLRHPSIVQVYEVGEQAGCPYLALELVEGENLARRLGGLPQPATEAARILATLAGAVEYAHRQGVIHRDLKPANVLVGGSTRSLARPPGTDVSACPPDEHELKITDFGLAKILPGPGVSVDRMTQSGMILGTPAYIAPEQARGQAKEAGPAADIYSLGAMLYELLTGRPPFQGTSPMETLLQAAHQEPVPASRLVARVPRDLDTICLKCLEKDPAKRYATAAELADDLGRFLKDEPIRARPVRLLGRLMRWGRRNPVPAALVSALALTGLVALGAIVWQWRKAERARRDADAFAQSEAAANVELKEQRLEAVAAQARAERAGDEARRRGAAERWERYRSNIAAAAEALQLQNSGTARRALDAAPHEHRNWEWRHLHNQLDNARAVIPGVTATSASFEWWRLPVISPSGNQIATLGKDERSIDLWDTTTGRVIGILRGHEGLVSAAAYSPDGKRLAIGSGAKVIRLWDPATGKETAVLRGLEKPAQWLSFSPDGRRIYSLDGESRSLEGSGRLWDADTGRAIAFLGGPASRLNALFTPDSRRIVIGLERQVVLYDATSGRQIAVLGSHEHRVNHLATSPDGKRIASHGETEKTIRLWDGGTGQEVAVLRGHTVSPGALVFSPDGSRLVSGGAYPDATVRLWESATGRPIAAMKGHKNTVLEVAFSPDGRRAVSATLDQTAWLWDGVTGQPIAPLRGHMGGLRNAIFSPDGTRVVTTSDDQTLRLWDAAAGELVAVLRGHKAEVRGAAFAAHGSLLVSLATDDEARVWDMELAERNGILRGHKSFVYDVAFSPDGTQAASAAWDGTARLWDLTTGRQTALLQHEYRKAEDEIVGAVAWHPSGRQLATVTRGDTITLWDLATGKHRQVFTAPTGEWTGDARAAFNPVGTLLASGSRDGSVRLWDVTTGKPAGALQGHQGPALDVAFNPGGNQLASVGFDRTVRLWDVATHAAVKVLPGDAEGYRIAYSADGRVVAASSLGGKVRLWDAHTYQELAVLPHENKVYGLAFNRDGSRLATACADSTIRLWDVATSQEVCELRGHEAYVHALAFSPDGTRLASASGDFTVRIWDTVPPSVRARPRQSPASRLDVSQRTAPGVVVNH